MQNTRKKKKKKVRPGIGRQGEGGARLGQVDNGSTD